ncbi:MAG: sugar phosphate isomerase/epimerase [Oscillospiraceae bacterium]|nr:sugar phosphate isomerase/epimerase [Oscillospiraceae bacterium]
MKKVSIGTWAFTFGAYADNPVSLEELCKTLSEIGYDGVSMGGFMPHAHPDLYDTEEKRAELQDMLKKYNLGVADFAADLWSVDSLKQTDEWLALFDKNCTFCKQMGWPIIRIDSGAPPILPEGKTYAEIKEFFIKTFKDMAQRAAKDGLEIVWEFEPGFIINEPKNIVDVVKAVNEPNFKLLFDTCHGHMAAVVGSRHIDEGMTLKGGLAEFIGMCKDLIGIVHVIDSDGTLNDAETSTHAPFGVGEIDFDEAIPAFLEAGYKADWWAIDLCEWPEALKVMKESKEFVDGFNKKYC